MKETRIPKLDVDPVGERLAHIVEEKKADNQDALGRIKALADSWKKLNKAIEADIKHEFELMDLEAQAVDEAIGDLDENRARPAKDAFTITGKVQSEREGIGLPNLTVLLLQRVGRKVQPLAKELTDNLGNFVFRLSEDAFGTDGPAKVKVELQVLAHDGTLLHSEVEEVAPRLGGIARLTLKAAETDIISSKLEAGKAVRDSIEDSRGLIASRLENMRGAHDALTKMTGIAREELDFVLEALAAAPPEIKSVLTEPEPARDDDGGTADGPGTEEEPEPPGDGEKGESDGREEDKDNGREKPDRPGGRLPGLAAINGIGPQRVKKLKRARIKDIEGFVAADNGRLREILGDLDFTAMKKDARVLLKEK